MNFIEYLGTKAPHSLRDYTRYWKRYRRLIEELNVSKLPCNKWLLKLMSNYLSWLSLTGADFRLVAAKREELRLKTRLCKHIIEKKEPQCREYILYNRSELGASIQRAVLYSGTRAKHLWLIKSISPIYRDTNIAIYDLRRSLGYKRVNVIIMPRDIENKVIEIVTRYSYKTAQKYFDPPVRCFRRYHWNLCLKATQDRTLCGFYTRPLETSRPRTLRGLSLERCRGTREGMATCQGVRERHIAKRTAKNKAR